jgi:hypothetical protein
MQRITTGWIGEHMADRIWYASPNGDWWAGDWHDEKPFVYVLHERDIPEDIEGVEEDKFEDLIMELGTKVEIPQVPDLI